MKSITGFVPRAVFLSLCIGLASAAAFAGEASYNPPPSYYYCTSNPAPKTRYYSLVFKVPGSGGCLQSNRYCIRPISNPEIRGEEQRGMFWKT